MRPPAVQQQSCAHVEKGHKTGRKPHRNPCAGRVDGDGAHGPVSCVRRTPLGHRLVATQVNELQRALACAQLSRRGQRRSMGSHNIGTGARDHSGTERHGRKRWNSLTTNGTLDLAHIHSPRQGRACILFGNHAETHWHTLTRLTASVCLSVTYAMHTPGLRRNSYCRRQYLTHMHEDVSGRQCSRCGVMHLPLSHTR